MIAEHWGAGIMNFDPNTRGVAWGLHITGAGRRPSYRLQDDAAVMDRNCAA
jgi:hypothetical protein